MKNIMLILCVLLSGCATTPHTEPGYDYGKGTGNCGVVWERPVFNLADGRVVEMIGIKVPSQGEPKYLMSTRYVQRVTQGHRVKLVYGIERKNVASGRVLAYVYVGDVFLNATMVRKGYAYAAPSPPNAKYDALLAELEAAAQKERLVIWESLDRLF